MKKKNLLTIQSDKCDERDKNSDSEIRTLKVQREIRSKRNNNNIQIIKSVLFYLPVKLRCNTLKLRYIIIDD